MKYMRVDWFHDSPDYLVKLYIEDGEDGYPLRQLELLDGRVGYAYYADDTFRNIVEYGGTKLGDQPSPDIDEINGSPELAAIEITKDEFEELRRQHVTDKNRPDQKLVHY